MTEPTIHSSPQHLLGKGGNIAALLLNQPVDSTETLVTSIWKQGVIRVAVDGGLNVFHGLAKQNPDFSNFIPTLITGDFDSASPELLSHYKSLGCEVIPTPSQDDTDLTKALHIVIEKNNQLQLNLRAIVVLVRVGGRLDHIMGNIESLFIVRKRTTIPVYLMDRDNVSWLLGPGSHRIKVGSDKKGRYCGLIPIGSACEHVTSTGLRWNVSDHKLAFGHLVSSSNQLDGSEEVTISTDQPLLWTMCISEENVANGKERPEDLLNGATDMKRLLGTVPNGV